RRHLYAEVARAVVPTDGRTPEEVTQAVLDALDGREVDEIDADGSTNGRNKRVDRADWSPGLRHSHSG
ncbi:hypothetical protein ABZT04_23760, partial [Streptomyces sp. NPDC005492]